MPSFATLADRCGGKTLIRLLALLLALAVSTPVLLAQEWDHGDHLNNISYRKSIALSIPHCHYSELFRTGLTRLLSATNPALNLPPDVSVFVFAKIQITGRLSLSGDAMTFNGRLTHYDPQGTKKGDPEPFNGAGTRIPLEILPNISDTLPLPPPQ